MVCPSIPTVSLGSFVNSLAANGSGGRMPLSGLLELTPHCNLQCAHCYIANTPWEGEVLTLPEIFRLMDELAEAGCLFLVLSGGEPLLRPDFLDVYSYAKKKGFLITLFTNGTLITPQIAEYLAEWPPRDVEITLYGASQETYQHITGSAEAFGRCLWGIELLRRFGVPFRLKTMVMTPHVEEIGAMAQLAQDLGVKFHFDSMINPALDSNRENCKGRLPPEEVVRLDLEDPLRREAWTQLAHQPPRTGDGKTQVVTCGAGRREFSIDAFGRLHPCVLLRDRGFDLRRGPFKEGFYKFMPAVLQQERTLPSPCPSCPERVFCHICAGWAHLETGKPEERPIPYLCQVARLRARAFRNGGEARG